MLQNNSRFQFGAVHLQIENRLDILYSVQHIFIQATAQSKYAVLKMEQEEETKTTFLL